MKFLLGRKLHMTQTFAPNGDVVPVTVVAAPPSVVTRVLDGNVGKKVQLGFAPKRPRAQGTKKPAQAYRILREFRLDPKETIAVGETVTAAAFAPGDPVQVTGWSKGKGFAGVVKRHHFKGHNTTHGTKDQVRMPGSIGAVFPMRVLKGKRMAGRMGNARTTVKNLRVVAVDPAKNLLAISGSLPGSHGSLVLIQGPRMPAASESREKVEGKKA